MKMRRLMVVAAIALALVLAFSGCSALMGKAGSIYGTIWWSSGENMVTYGLATYGGFPATVTKNVAYQVQPGSYYFDYYLYDSYYTYAMYAVYYSVAANPGKLFADGSEKDFTIDCYTDGAIVSGTNVVPIAPSVAPAKDLSDGTTTKQYSVGDYTITLSYKKIAGFPDPSKAVELK